MKKILLFLTVVMMTLSVTLISACGKDEGSVPEESVSSASESASQSIRPSRVINSGNSDKSTNPANSDSDDDSGNTSISVPDDIYAEGEPYTVTQGEQNTGTAADDVIGLINMIGTIDSTNYTKRKQMIDLAQQSYDALASQFKGLVSNYASLGYARQAYENFVASVSKTAIEMLKEAITKISDLTVDASFASDIAACESYYEKIGDSFKSQVTAEINQLNAAKFTQTCSTLPDDANALRLSNVDTVNTLTDMLAKNDAQNQMSSIAAFASVKAKYQACFNKMISATVEDACIAQDLNGNGIMETSVVVGGKTYNELLAQKKRSDGGSAGFKFSGGIENGSDDQFFMYTDTKNLTPVKIWMDFKGTCTYTAACAGTLTLYFRPGNPREYTVTLGSETLGTIMSGEANTDCIKTFEITTAGQITVTAKGGTGYYCAVKFSHPNLPQ